VEAIPILAKKFKLEGPIDHDNFEKLELDLDKVRFDYSKANSEATKSLMSLQKVLVNLRPAKSIKFKYT